MDNGVEFPLLLDPGHRLYETLNIHHIHWWKLLSPLTWCKYLRSARRARQGRITDIHCRPPGSSSSTRTALSGTSTALVNFVLLANTMLEVFSTFNQPFQVLNHAMYGVLLALSLVVWRNSWPRAARPAASVRPRYRKTT